MIESIAVKHFQSLHDVHLEFGHLTVAVGPSSSGKSALMRALYTVVSNRRGADFITHGERIATITVRTSQGIVTLTRGKGTDDNAYIVIPNDPGHPLAPQQRYTKLGGDVPEEVTAFLGITPGDRVAFASQFDKPYLLDDSPGNVAKTLGELTNVRVIYDAAKESNRQKLDASKRLKVRADDLASIKAKVPEYKALKSQEAAQTEAETLLREAVELYDAAKALQASIDSLEVNEARLEPLRRAAAIEVPDEDELVEAYRELIQYRTTVAEWQAAEKALEAAIERRYLANLEVDELGEAYGEKLGELAEGFGTYMREHGSIHPGPDGATEMIAVEMAAILAAKYVESFIRD